MIEVGPRFKGNIVYSLESTYYETNYHPSWRWIYIPSHCIQIWLCKATEGAIGPWNLYSNPRMYYHHQTIKYLMVKETAVRRCLFPREVMTSG